MCTQVWEKALHRVSSCQDPLSPALQLLRFLGARVPRTTLAQGPNGCHQMVSHQGGPGVRFSPVKGGTGLSVRCDLFRRPLTGSQECFSHHVAAVSEIVGKANLTVLRASSWRCSYLPVSALDLVEQTLPLR